MRLLYGSDAQIAFWVGQRIGRWDFGPCAAIGVIHNGRIIAGVVYYGFDSGDMEISMAADSPRWATRQAIGALLRYPFVQCDCRRVTCKTRSDNTHTQNILTRLGFTHEGTIRAGLPDSDIELFGLLKSECKWI